MKPVTLIVMGLMLMLPAHAIGFDHTHAAFTSLLQKQVRYINNGLASEVDYAAIKRAPAPLESYLKTLSAVDKQTFHDWPESKRLSYLINAYNAFTIQLIVKHYPVQSIKKIGFFLSSPWKIDFIPLLGAERSLDEIEHDMIRQKGVYDEPRIHFALVCASIGCPALQNTAFTHDRLETMLETGLVTFLSDKTRNRYNDQKNRFYVSNIFNWYGDDFNEKYGSVTKLLQQYSRYLVSDETVIDQAKHTEKVAFLDYDWHLNDTRNP